MHTTRRTNDGFTRHTLSSQRCSPVLLRSTRLVGHAERMLFRAYNSVLCYNYYSKFYNIIRIESGFDVEPVYERESARPLSL